MGQKYCCLTHILGLFDQEGRANAGMGQPESGARHFKNTPGHFEDTPESELTRVLDSVSWEPIKNLDKKLDSTSVGLICGRFDLDSKPY